MIGSLIIGSDNLAQIASLKNAVADTFVNDATCTVTLYNNAGTEVSGETWPLSMGYVAASDGIYRAIITDTVTSNLSPNKRYRLVYSADGGADLKRDWHVWVNAIRG